MVRWQSVPALDSQPRHQNRSRAIQRRRTLLGCPPVRLRAAARINPGWTCGVASLPEQTVRQPPASGSHPGRRIDPPISPDVQAITDVPVLRCAENARELLRIRHPLDALQSVLEESPGQVEEEASRAEADTRTATQMACQQKDSGIGASRGLIVRTTELGATPRTDGHQYARSWNGDDRAVRATPTVTARRAHDQLCRTRRRIVDPDV